MFNRKQFFGALLGALAMFSIAVKINAASNDYSDFWTIKGIGSLYNVAIAWIDTTRDLVLYDGDLVLGGKGSAPSTTAGEYPAVKIPIKNNSGAAWAQGNLIVVDPACTGCGKMVNTNAVTSWLGFSEGTVASGSVGYIITSGYAIVKTTSTVNIGDTLVSTQTTTSAGFPTQNPGFTIGASAPTTGTDTAVALTSGTAAGGTVLAKVR